MYVIGLMSGTSADGIDAAIVSWPEEAVASPHELLAFIEVPFSLELQKRIHALAAGRLEGKDAIRELALLDVLLGRKFAEAAIVVANQAGFSQEEMAKVAIATHGQTVGHFPESNATLQIGDPSVIAQLTGCTTVADFRTRDVAAGGEGAPLAPFFHDPLFSDLFENRVVLNLGGIANVTWLPPGRRSQNVMAFDVGPANVLMDCVIQQTDPNNRFDRDGRLAAQGSVQSKWLKEMLDDPYLERRPPKSTGREHYGPVEAQHWLDRSRREGKSVEDLLATLSEFTAVAISNACNKFLIDAGPIDRMIVGGGGVKNSHLIDEISSASGGLTLDFMNDHGVPPDAAEAMAFSLMGRNALLGIPNHLPACTGASEELVLGEIVPGRPGLKVYK